MSQDKLKFYEEVLELEPGSKLFFPLAKLYFLNKDTELAINTLTKGLEKYPEHLEAKLLLASIHKQAGNTQQSRAIHQDIFALFSSNQEFWDSIATDLAENGQNDLALAASFFSMSARQKDATWSDIMWSGLKSLNMPHAANDKTQETISHHPSGSLETEPELPVPDSQQEEPSQEQSYEDRHVQHPEETPVADEDIDPTETEFLPETKTPSEASEPQEKSDPEDGQLDLDQDLISREDPSSLSKEDQELDLDAMFEPMDQEDDSQDSETQDPLADFDENFETEDKKTVETPDDPEVQKDTPDHSLEETPEDDLEKSLQEQDAQPEQLERTATGEAELYEDPEELDDFDLESDAKTRSMADILFGQEEYAKALDIYEELWKSSLPGQEREHLDEMINKTRQAMVEQEDSQEKPEDEHEQKHEQENEQEAGHEDSVLEQEHTVDQSHQPIEEPAEPSGQQQATFSHEGQETIPTSDDDFELPENLSVSEKQDTEEISEKEEAEKAQEETQELNQQDNQEPAKEKKDEAVDFLMALADRLEARSSQEPEQQK